jgi:hypothetical protein
MPDWILHLPNVKCVKQMHVDQMPFDQMPFDQMPLDQIPFDQMPFDQMFLTNGKEQCPGGCIIKIITAVI